MTNNGNHNYTVTGTLRGASDTGQETAIKIDFTGTVPFNNYSTPPAPEAPKATMTVGDLYYNGDNVFFLGLKDGSPIKEYGITFYITLAPTDPLQLASGDYTGGAAGENMTFDLAKSFWNYNDPTYGIIKNRITEETLKIVANGNDDYTITGSFKAIDEDDKNTELEIEYTGKLPARITPIDLLGVARRQKTGPIHNQTGFSQDDIPYKNFSEFIPQHDSDPHILSLCQRTLLSVEISESGRQPESRIPEDRTNLAPHIPGFRPAAPYFTDDNKESEQKQK